MQDGNFRVDGLAGLSGEGISQFAAEVVTRLVGRGAASAVTLREPLLARFYAAVRSHDPMAFEAFKPDLRRARVSFEVLADVYIPEVARRLGQDWEADRVSFAEVTIGTARLQAILRDIGANWQADGRIGQGRASILLVVPTGEQHSLGALVAAGWLRRKGISVCLRMGLQPAEAGDLLAARRFDAAMISVACHERLELCTKLVKTLKDASQNTLRVAVGGAIVGQGGELATIPEADIVTNDLSEAVEVLGLLRMRASTAGIT